MRVKKVFKPEDLNQDNPDILICRYIWDRDILIPFSAGSYMGSFTGDIIKGTTATRETKKINGFLEISLDLKNPVLLDIGSNAGSYSFLTLFNPDLKVIAFEPLDFVYKDFLKIIELNNIPNITVYNNGLSDKYRKCSMSSPPNNVGGSKIKINTEGECEFITLDSLNIDKADLIKIDVEGHQMEVLEGAKETLKRCKPTFIQIEMENNKQLIKIKSEYLNGYIHYQIGIDYLFFKI